MKGNELKIYLDSQVEIYNVTSFIPEDPVSIPHRFSLKQDIEIIAFWVAILSWGNRKSIIRSGNRLVELMGGHPYYFVLNHTASDRKSFESFVHRTFNGDDSFYFLEFFQNYYRDHLSLEDGFAGGITTMDAHVGPALVYFKSLFVKLANPPNRTLKHISSPESNSRCKRILMFLRWMVRTDAKGVDFGIWKKISPAQLLIPLDVHVEKIARTLGLLQRKQLDWMAVLELSNRCKELNAKDPVLYDFALFNLGLNLRQNLREDELGILNKK